MLVASRVCKEYMQRVAMSVIVVVVVAVNDLRGRAGLAGIESSASAFTCPS